MSIKMPEKPKFSKKFIIYLLVSISVLTILLFSEGINMVEYKIGGYFGLIGVFDGIPLLIYAIFFIPECMDYRLAKTDFPKYVKEQEEKLKRRAEYNHQQQIEHQKRQELLEKERQIAIKSQENSAPWAVKYSVHPCPHCGHYKVRCAKWEDKKKSVAFWGIHSSKLAANYKCEHCGEMWE